MRGGHSQKLRGHMSNAYEDDTSSSPLGAEKKFNFTVGQSFKDE